MKISCEYVPVSRWKFYGFCFKIAQHERATRSSLRASSFQNATFPRLLIRQINIFLNLVLAILGDGGQSALASFGRGSRYFLQFLWCHFRGGPGNEKPVSLDENENGVSFTGFQFSAYGLLVQMSKVRIVIVPGNGGGDVERSNWYGWLRDKLRQVSKRFKHCTN